MASPSKEQLTADIKAVLKGADLAQLSSKKVRKQLEEKYSVDLTERKKEIDKLLMTVIEAQQEKEDEEEANDDSDVDEQGASASVDVDSDDSNINKPENVEPLRKKSKTSAKKVDDEVLARQLQEEEETSMRRTRGSANRRTPAKSLKSKDKKDKPKNSNRKQNGYTKPALLSPALAHILGTDRLPRNEVVKKIWEIARERNMFDPSNKRFIICDDEFYSLFKRKRVLLFGCMKHLTNHIVSADHEDDIL